MSSSLSHACAISGIIIKTSSHSGDDAFNLNTCIALNPFGLSEEQRKLNTFHSLFFFFPMRADKMGSDAETDFISG